ncbi:unnamed protein product [Rotaria magnacalcarata]
MFVSIRFILIIVILENKIQDIDKEFMKNHQLLFNEAHDDNIVYSNADANYYTIKDDNMRLLMKDVHHEDDYSNL